METQSKNYEQQIGLWTHLGPFVMLITLTIVLMYPGRQSLAIPFLSLLFLPLCWKLKYKGLAMALSGIFAVLVFQLWISPPQRIFWDLMLTATAALTFGITALCSLEVDSLFVAMQQDSSTRLQDLLATRDRLLLVQEQKDREILDAKAINLELEQKLTQENARLKASEENVQASREKTNNILMQNESLLRELFQKRHECDKISSQLQALQIEHQQLEMQVSQSKENVSTLESLLELGNLELEKSQEAANKFMAASDANEAILSEKIQKLEKQLKTSLEVKDSIQEREKKYLLQIEELEKCLANLMASKEPSPNESTKETSKPPSPPKGKAAKASKTNNWANAILSRWSESDDLPQ